MPQNKRESLIFTIMMCFVMVLWMSFYNVALQQAALAPRPWPPAGWGFPSPISSACAAIGSWPPKFPRAWPSAFWSSPRTAP